MTSAETGESAWSSDLGQWTFTPLPPPLTKLSERERNCSEVYICEELSEGKVTVLSLQDQQWQGLSVLVCRSVFYNAAALGRHFSHVYQHTGTTQRFHNEVRSYMPKTPNHYVQNGGPVEWSPEITRPQPYGSVILEFVKGSVDGRPLLTTLNRVQAQGVETCAKTHDHLCQGVRHKLFDFFFFQCHHMFLWTFVVSLLVVAIV